MMRSASAIHCETSTFYHCCCPQAANIASILHCRRRPTPLAPHTAYTIGQLQLLMAPPRYMSAGTKTLKRPSASSNSRHRSQKPKTTSGSSIT
jgi:hypothetical protein